MRIAVIGWGSLIWNPSTLKTNSDWHNDGPRLPVEFARISKDGRLTLVLMPEVEPQQTLWAMSSEDLDEARGNLRDREGTADRCIHSLHRDGSTVGDMDGSIKEIIETWLRERRDLDAAVWTGLGCNWNCKRGQDFTQEDAIAYLREIELDQEKWEKAREYVVKAPAQIRTPLRKRIEEEFGWTPEDP